MSRGPYDYTVEIDLPGDAAKLPCRCGSCEWRGMASDVLDIEQCSLTPGDPSPVGRCPSAETCESLVYLDRPQDRITDAAEELHRALELLVNRHDMDPPMLTSEEWEQARSALAKARAA